ncbi:MAG: ornithine--oxo-acid transaminase [Acidobacteriia bacterium]|nr:ornithine--oxo-acid transaminase [Terriglobia bacterium]
MLALEDEWGAHNYHPLPVVVARAEGPWVFDVDGARYLDCLSAYSAVNQGHCHPRILQALRDQAERVTLTSRAYRNDQLPLFCRELAELCGMQMVLPMNTGAEAVETAIKAARKWAYDRKGVAPGRAEILVCENNFHGRTTTIVGFSSDADSRLGFGPFTPGFRSIPFGDAGALAEAITPDTCAFLVEPVQCEAGVLIPPAGYLAEAARICRERGVLLVVDEIQTGLGRTGALFACQHEGVQPDVYVLGKALSGGFYPVSAVVSSRDVLGVFSPGTHGSTFGGNPLGCAVAREALRVLADENLVERAAVLGHWFLDQLRTLSHPDIVEIRGIGLIAGIELRVPARPFCERLRRLGMLCKETHDRVIRIAPPLVVEREELTWALDRLREAFGR